MSERERQATRESIATYGFIDPLTVRPHPDIEGHYQVIDGEHRWLAALDLGFTELPATVVEVSDSVAKKLTVVLNETRGRPDAELLGDLLSELQAEMGDDFLVALPYSPADLEDLMHIEIPELDPAPAPVASNDPWFTITARCPQDFDQVWGEVEQKVLSLTTLHDDPKVRAGQMVEILSAEFLAGA